MNVFIKISRNFIPFVNKKIEEKPLKTYCKFKILLNRKLQTQTISYNSSNCIETHTCA